jgi:hypothetical protein
MKTSKLEKTTSELEQAEEVGALLVISNKQSAALRQPTERALDYPPFRLVSTGPARGALFLADRTDVADIAVFCNGVVAGGVVIPLSEQGIRLLRQRGELR